MPVRQLFHNTFIGNELHRKWQTIRGWICANMAHMRRRNGVLGVSAIVARARSERIVRPWIAGQRERDCGRGRSPSCQARMAPLAYESSLPPQNSRLGDPALSDFERVGRETALSLESDRATGRYADPVL
jgi:hypothetical protein